MSRLRTGNEKVARFREIAETEIRQVWSLLWEIGSLLRLRTGNDNMTWFREIAKTEIRQVWILC